MQRAVGTVLMIGLIAMLSAPVCARADLGSDSASQTGGAAAVCVHYVNRARFKSRAEAVEFTTVLADACDATLATLDDPAASPERVAAARHFLNRLDAARGVITLIDGLRMRAAPTRAVSGPRLRDVRATRGLVTLTGEFLILRHAGVFAALKAWVATGADFPLVAAIR